MMQPEPTHAPLPGPSTTPTAIRAALLLATAMTVGLLAGCGGGGSGSASGSGSGSSSSDSTSLRSVQGQVLDGPIEGATVCLDRNANGRCDADEPAARTDSSGRYALDLPASTDAEQVLLAEVPTDARDADDDGKTLAQAGRAAFTLASSVGQSAVISPFTALMVGRVRAGLETDMAQARLSLIEAWRLPAATDFQRSHSDNPSLRGLAQALAAQMQSGTAASDAQQRLAALAQQWQRQSLTAQSGDLLGLPVDITARVQQDPAQFTGLERNVRARFITYRMPRALDGRPINATAMLFTPDSAPPSGGWPLVVLASGTTGVASACAPSLGHFDYAAVAALMVASGSAVVVPDYEGRGPVSTGEYDAHPYLNLASAGRSVALAALASQRALGSQLSGQWAIWGHSQGGHAALAGAQYASLATGMRYLGAVAVAPASGLRDTVRNVLGQVAAATQVAQYPAAYAQLATLNGYASYLVQGSSYTDTPIAAGNLFGPRLLALHQTGARRCLSDFAALLQADLQSWASTSGATPSAYPGLQSQALEAADVTAALQANEPAQPPLSGRTLIIQGQSDSTVLPSITDALVARMQAQGSNVQLLKVNGRGHVDVLVDPTAVLASTVHLRGLLLFP